MQRHLKILQFALIGLARRKGKNLAILLVYTLTVALLASVLLLSHALQREAQALLEAAPELVVQHTLAGRHAPASARAAAVRPRRW